MPVTDNIMGKKIIRKKSFFVVGDSISVQYGPYLKRMVCGVFDCGREIGSDLISDDAGDDVGVYCHNSSGILDYLSKQLHVLKRYDIMLFNCGLHDIETDPKTRKKQVEIKAYKQNLEGVLGVMHRMAVFPVWVNTTPVDDAKHNSVIKELVLKGMISRGFERHDQDVVKYNKVAAQLMEENNVPLIDLYTFSKNLGKHIYCDNVHFKEEVRSLQAAFIAGRLFSYRR